MSSVIIKGMEMPECCGRCDISAKISMPSGVILRCRSGKIVRTPINDSHDVLNKRHPNCPLGVLPDTHGRLVDADSLKNKLKFINEAEHQIYGSGSWGFTAKCIHAIDDAPTIVESEGEE